MWWKDQYFLRFCCFFWHWGHLDLFWVFWAASKWPSRDSVDNLFVNVEIEVLYASASTIHDELCQVIFFVVVIGEPQQGFVQFLWKPSHTLHHPVLRFWQSWIFNISLNRPRSIKSRQIFTSSFIEEESSVWMGVQESRRNTCRLFSLYCSQHNVCLNFWPSHNDDLFCLFDSVDAHR